MTHTSTKSVVYKLTTQDNKTRAGHTNECVWGPGVEHTATGRGGLCSEGAIHAYTHPLLAMIFNPRHANLKNPKLWRGEMEITLRDRGNQKVGGKSVVTLEEIPLPIVTERIRRVFAILCAKAAFEISDKRPNSFWLRDTDRARKALGERQKWEEWAEAFLRGEVSADTAEARIAARKAAASADAYASAYAADADAAYAAAAAAYASAYAADADAYAADADAYAAAYAYAAYGAYGAADAAYSAAAYAYAAKSFDLTRLAEQVVEICGG